MCLSIDGNMNNALAQNMPSSITVNTYELSMFIFRLIYCEVD
jgi:hypothetical protein